MTSTIAFATPGPQTSARTVERSGSDPPCARTSLAEEEGGSSQKLRKATRGANPTGDDGDRHAGSESCVIVKRYTGDRDHEA